MSNRTRRPKTASPRIRKLFKRQAYKCPCGNEIDNSRYFDNGDVLTCSSCNQS